MDLLHSALADTAEISLIAEQLSAQPAGSDWTSKAQLMMKSDARARDYQFELFVAALFSRAGYETILAEPDVVIQTDRGPVGVAAKRSHSWANLHELVGRADAQIRRTGRIGILALDISYLTNPDEDRMVGFGSRPVLRRVRRTVDDFLRERHDEMLGRVDRQRTIGVVVYACQLAIDRAQRRFTVSRGSVFGNFCSLQDPNLELFTSIRQRLTVAV